MIKYLSVFLTQFTQCSYDLILQRCILIMLNSMLDKNKFYRFVLVFPSSSLSRGKHFVCNAKKGYIFGQTEPQLLL